MQTVKLLLPTLALLLAFAVEHGVASPSPPIMPCGISYGQKPCLFLPSFPQETPKCATKGSTFCETADGYPENLINKLLKNYITTDILADESKIDFGAKKQTTYNIPPYGPPPHPHHGPFNNYGDFHGPAAANHHSNNNYQHLHRQRGNSYGDNTFAGYHYPRPKASSSSFFQIKPPSTINFNHPDIYRRTSRQVHPFLNETELEASQITPTALDRFMDSVAARSKRQISSNREQLCEVRSNFINPQAALNVRTGNWMYIVNGAETATQLVRTETCVSSQCSNLCQLPNGYNSRCEQKYVQKRLVTLDPQGEKLFTDTFWFPSCCVCTLSNSIE